MALAIHAGKTAAAADQSLAYVYSPALFLTTSTRTRGGFGLSAPPSLTRPLPPCLATRRALAAAAPTHPLVLDLAEKERAFDDAASKFQVAQAA